ncbi:hypothetical protein [Anthocerotibacter panamensis]|uniref:hypothetical protein n=1 Tax=Anthocerotibacter panamensis TaxID=2857077 RepID=UPI001C405630|nr:hypothetical protein [Anthocerotibacter panamensis]
METVNLTHQIPVIDVRPSGFMVSRDLKGNNWLIAVIRLQEPDTRLLDVEVLYNRHIQPLNFFFSNEDSVGLNEQLQIVRYRRNITNSHLLGETYSASGSPHLEDTARIYQDFALRQMEQGLIPVLCTYLFLSYTLEKKVISRQDLDKSEKLIQQRAAGFCAAFTEAGYGVELLTAPQEVIRPVWEYWNPEASYYVGAPKPKRGLVHGQLSTDTLQRYPEAAVESLRRDLANTSVAFSPRYAVVGTKYVGYLALVGLPERASHGFEDLFALEGVDYYISQTWFMTGKTTIAKELEKRDLVARDLQGSFGQRVANLGLDETVQNVQELRRDLARTSNVVRYTMTIRVAASSLEGLEEAMRLVVSIASNYPGTTFFAESSRPRVKQAMVAASPGVPPTMVDYRNRGHIVRSDLLCWFIPHYGMPNSDPVSDGIPYITYWSERGGLVRKALVGPTSGTCMLVFGPPGTGKGVACKVQIQQLMLLPFQYVWTVDTNTELTSYDFQTRHNQGLNIRFTEDGSICLPTFDIAGSTPTVAERIEITSSLWFDIHRKPGVDLSGEQEALLTRALLKAYQIAGTSTNYDTFVHVLLSLAKEESHQPTKDNLINWARSLESFCSGEFITKLYEFKSPNGQFYAYFGRNDGLRIRDLLAHPTVSWSLSELTNPYMKAKISTLLRARMLSFAEVLTQLSIEQGNNYTINLFIDEGWGFFALDEGRFLAEITRRRRHFGVNIWFITQFVDDLNSPAGLTVRKAANQWILLGSGEGTEDVIEALSLTQTEAELLPQLKRVAGVYGQFFYRRRNYNGSLESMLLVNPVPATQAGSWIALLTGHKPECILRQNILKLLGADSITEATPEQCQIAAWIFGRVWPNGLPVSHTDTEKLSREAGWLQVLDLVNQLAEEERVRRALDNGGQHMEQLRQARLGRSPSTGILAVFVFWILTFSVHAQAQFSLCVATNPYTGQTFTVNCDLQVNDPQNHDYVNSAGVTPQAPGGEYTFQRQQSLLQKSILQGQANQTGAQATLNQDIPQLRAQVDNESKNFCNTQAQPAYDQAQTAFNQAAAAYQSAAAAPYVYDQIAAQNNAYQLYAQALALKAVADKQGLNCSTSVGQGNTAFLQTVANLNAQTINALGQLQEAQSAQKQWEVDQAAQQGRSVFGLQANFNNLLSGLTSRTQVPTALRPTKY